MADISDGDPLEEDLFPDALPPGTQLGDYEIRRVLGQGGFGITYEGFHRFLGRRVAIKEFFVKQACRRREDGTVLLTSAAARDGLSQEDYRRLLSKFEREARKIAGKFDHPGIVQGEAYMVMNGVGYLVMRHVDGITVDQWLRRLGRPPTERELAAVMLPALEAVDYLHGLDEIHRDLTPKNIMIRPDGRPVLIDFGNSREGLDRSSYTSVALATSGYAPPEQCIADDTARQGRYTDVYALGAILYRAITGKAPMASTDRASAMARRRGAADPHKPAAEAARDRTLYSDRFLAGVDSALALDETDRPQSVGEFLVLLGWAPAGARQPEPEPPTLRWTPEPAPARPEPAPPPAGLRRVDVAETLPDRLRSPAAAEASTERVPTGFPLGSPFAASGGSPPARAAGAPAASPPDPAGATASPPVSEPAASEPKPRRWPWLDPWLVHGLPMALGYMVILIVTGVVADLERGARVPILSGAAWGHLAGLLVAWGTGLIVLRRRPTHERPLDFVGFAGRFLWLVSIGHCFGLALVYVTGIASIDFDGFLIGVVPTGIALVLAAKASKAMARPRAPEAGARETALRAWPDRAAGAVTLGMLAFILCLIVLVERISDDFTVPLLVGIGLAIPALARFLPSTEGTPPLPLEGVAVTAAAAPVTLGLSVLLINSLPTEVTTSKATMGPYGSIWPVPGLILLGVAVIVVALLRAVLRLRARRLAAS